MDQEARQRVPDPLRGGPAFAADASPLPPFTEVSRATARYLGNAACKSCHPSEYESYQATKHAKALETLVAVRAEYDPRCLGCHTTGFGHPSGFTSIKNTLNLADVGCESCHGPGSDHQAKQPYGQLPESGAACVACHSHDNSPDFRFESYWPSIRHGSTL
jgi:hypothetical protein